MTDQTPIKTARKSKIDARIIGGGAMPPILCGEIEQLLSALRFVKAAISQEETRYYLKSVLFQIDRTGSHVVSTDGHRLHHASLGEVKHEGVTGTYLLKREDALAILKTFGTKKAAHKKLYRLDFAKGTLTVYGPNMADVVYSAFEATFPDWMRVVPQQIDETLAVNAFDLYGVCTASAALDRGGAVRFTADKAARTLTLEAHRSRTQKDVPTRSVTISETIPDLNVLESCEIGLNPTYVLDMAAAFGRYHQNLRLFANDGFGPCVWRSDDTDHFVVVMPMRI